MRLRKPYLKASVPLRSASAHFVTWIISRPPTKHALRAADLALLSARPTRVTCGLGAVVCAANLRRAPSHAVGRGSSPPTPRQVGGCGLRNAATKGSYFHGARPARASPRGEPADRPWSTHYAADLARLSLSLHPTPLAEALLHRHRARSSGATPKRHNQRLLVPWRAARAHFVTCRISRPPTEHARSADLARLSLRPTRNALHPTSLAEALLHRHRARSARASSERRNRKFIIIRWPAAHARFVTWRTSRLPTERVFMNRPTGEVGIPDRPTDRPVYVRLAGTTPHSHAERRLVRQFSSVRIS